MANLKPEQPQKKPNILQRITFGINVLFNPVANLPQPTQSTSNFGRNSKSSNWDNVDSEDIDSESEIEIDESEEYPAEW